MKFFLIILLILQCGIIVFALNLSVKTKVKVIWLDPYLQISIQGADGYAVAEPVFDEDAFRTDFEDILQKKDSSLQSLRISVRRHGPFCATGDFFSPLSAIRFQ